MADVSSARRPVDLEHLPAQQLASDGHTAAAQWVYDAAAELEQLRAMRRRARDMTEASVNSSVPPWQAVWHAAHHILGGDVVTDSARDRAISDQEGQATANSELRVQPARDRAIEAAGWLRSMVSTSSRDWGQASGDALVYGVLVGWDCPPGVCDEAVEDAEHWCERATADLAARHGWTAATVEKMRERNAALRALAGEAGAPDTPPADELMGQALVQIERLREDVAMYERWAEQSPTRVIECSCGNRHQVRIADHEISEAVPAATPTPTGDLAALAKRIEDAAGSSMARWHAEDLRGIALDLRAVLARHTEETETDGR